jgi:hypothetical protein
MADHPNATLVRRLYETFDRKGVPTISALLSTASCSTRDPVCDHAAGNSLNIPRECLG